CARSGRRRRVRRREHSGRGDGEAREGEEPARSRQGEEARTQRIEAPRQGGEEGGQGRQEGRLGGRVCGSALRGDRRRRQLRRVQRPVALARDGRNRIPHTVRPEPLLPRGYPTDRPTRPRGSAWYRPIHAYAPRSSSPGRV